MYFKKADILKVFFVLSILLVVTVLVIFMLLIKNADVQKNMSIAAPKLKTASSAVAIPIPSHRNQPHADNSSSNTEKHSEEISNLERVQSNLTKKLELLESKIAEIRENQHLAVLNEYDGNNNQNNNTEMHPEIKEDALGPIKEDIDLLETIQSEPVDVEWSDSATKALYNSVQKNATGSVEIINVDCRSTLCRVEFFLNTPFKEEGFKELEKISPPWNGEGFFEFDENSGLAVMYIAREGHSLPRL